MLLRIVFPFLLLLSWCGPVLIAQWNPISDFPGGSTDASFSFVIDDVAYVGGGLNSLRFYAYDRTTMDWDDLGVLPGEATRPWAFGFAYNGKGYMGGGSLSGSSVVSDFYEYDPAANSWTRKAPFGGGPRDGCFSFVLGDKAYVGAGFDGQFIGFDVWEYSFSENVWTRIGNFPGGAVLFSSAFVLNGKGYVVGGGGQTESPALFEFDPATKDWTRKADFPGTPRQAGAAFALHGLGYYGAGMAGYSQTFKDFWMYDPSTDQWSMLEDEYPDEFSAWVVTFVLGDKAYAGIGARFAGSSVDLTDRFYSFSDDVNSVENPLFAPAGLSAAPNPATDAVDLLITLSRTQDVEINLVDMLGRRVAIPLRKTIEPGKQHETIDLSSLSVGAYFVELSSNGEVQRTKIVKVP